MTDDNPASGTTARSTDNIERLTRGWDHSPTQANSNADYAKRQDCQSRLEVDGTAVSESQLGQRIRMGTSSPVPMSSAVRHDRAGVRT